MYITLNNLQNNTIHIGKTISVKGRIHATRKMKNYIFIDLLDKGKLLQLILINSNLTSSLTCGDLIQVTGELNRTKTGLLSLFCHNNEIKIITKWQNSISYKNFNESHNTYLKNNFTNLEISFKIYNLILAFLTSKGFTNTLTPILGEKFNGGRSFPVYSKYLNNKIGFNRTTFEERMQALIAIGFESVFQIGSVFRSSNEMFFIEGYSVNLNFNSGIDLLKEMCSYIVIEMELNNFELNERYLFNLKNKLWNNYSYLEIVNNYFNDDIGIILTNYDDFYNYLIKKEFIVDAYNKKVSPETLADLVIDKIMNLVDIPEIITHYPIWSSPLYDIDQNSNFLLRAKIKLPNQKLGFDLGLQENDYKKFVKRELNQKIYDSEKSYQSNLSQLNKVISSGVYKTFGFGLNISRFISLYSENPSFDPLH